MRSSQMFQTGITVGIVLLALWTPAYSDFFHPKPNTAGPANGIPPYPVPAPKLETQVTGTKGPNPAINNYQAQPTPGKDPAPNGAIQNGAEVAGTNGENQIDKPQQKQSVLMKILSKIGKILFKFAPPQIKIPWELWKIYKHYKLKSVRFKSLPKWAQILARVFLPKHVVEKMKKSLKDDPNNITVMGSVTKGAKMAKETIKEHKDKASSSTLEGQSAQGQAQSRPYHYDSRPQTHVMDGYEDAFTSERKEKDKNTTTPSPGSTLDHQSHLGQTNSAQGQDQSTPHHIQTNPDQIQATPHHFQSQTDQIQSSMPYQDPILSTTSHMPSRSQSASYHTLSGSTQRQSPPPYQEQSIPQVHPDQGKHHVMDGFADAFEKVDTNPSNPPSPPGTILGPTNHLGAPHPGNVMNHIPGQVHQNVDPAKYPYA